jgi:DNA-binding transcriptional regulator YiaG
MDSMGEHVKRLREGQSLSQEALARLIGVSVRTVVRWESGESRPSPLANEKLQRIAPNVEDGDLHVSRS